MPSYYLDIETTGLDQNNDSIITIQYQKLQRGSGEPASDVVILKEWESGEKGMLEKLIADTGICSPSPFDFISVGYNLGFEHKFLYAKSKYHGLEKIEVMNRPHVDLHSVGILMNAGEFKGSGLDKITGKKQSGLNIPIWHREKNYTAIEDYIIDETNEFIKWYRWLVDKMPDMRTKWNADLLSTLVKL